MAKENKIEISVKTIKQWQDVLNFWADYIEELSFQYPRTAKKYEKFNEILTDIYCLTQEK